MSSRRGGYISLRGIHSRLELWKHWKEYPEWFAMLGEELLRESEKRLCNANAKRSAEVAQLHGKGMERLEKRLSDARNARDDAATEERRLELLVHAAHAERRERDRVVTIAEQDLAVWQELVFQVMDATGAAQDVAARALEVEKGSAPEAAALVMTWEENRQDRARGKRRKESR